MLRTTEDRSIRGFLIGGLASVVRIAGVRPETAIATGVVSIAGAAVVSLLAFYHSRALAQSPQTSYVAGLCLGVTSGMLARADVAELALGGPGVVVLLIVILLLLAVDSLLPHESFLRLANSHGASLCSACSAALGGLLVVHLRAAPELSHGLETVTRFIVGLFLVAGLFFSLSVSGAYSAYAQDVGRPYRATRTISDTIVSFLGLVGAWRVGASLNATASTATSWAPYYFSSFFQGFAALLGIGVTIALVGLQLLAQEYGPLTGAHRFFRLIEVRLALLGYATSTVLGAVFLGLHSPAPGVGIQAGGLLYIGVVSLLLTYRAVAEVLRWADQGEVLSTLLRQLAPASPNRGRERLTRLGYRITLYEIVDTLLHLADHVCPYDNGMVASPSFYPAQ